MPVDPISTTLLICERVITDKDDGVHSAIRLIDLIEFTPRPNIPPQERPLPLSILFGAKFPHEDETEHKIQIRLERPDGKSFAVGEAGPVKAPTTPPGIPKGLNLTTRFGVHPTMTGVHYIIIV